MALNAARRWLIAYDISDPKRLARVYRFMLKRGIPLQLSLFITELTTRQAQRLGKELCALINNQEDDVRLYPLPEDARITRLGRTDLLGENVFDNRLTCTPSTRKSHEAPAQRADVAVVG